MKRAKRGRIEINSRIDYLNASEAQNERAAAAPLKPP